MNPSDERTGVNRRDFLKGVAAGAVGLGITGSVAGDLLAQESKAGEKEKPERVKTRVLGRTKIPCSVITFGGVPLRPEHVPWLKAAWERGVNMFDVAWGYGGGQAEVALGQLMETVKDREKIYVCTKASGFRSPGGSAKKVYEELEKGVAKSFERIKTDYIDVFFWPHGASTPEALKDRAVRDALLRLKEKKLIRHIGVSSHSNYVETCLAAVEEGFYDVLMPVLNVATQNREQAAPPDKTGKKRQRIPEDTTTMLAAAKKKNVGVIAMKCAKARHLPPNVEELIEKEYPGGAGFSHHQKLYAYGLAQEGVSTVVVGIQNLTHLKEAIALGCAV